MWREGDKVEYGISLFYVYTLMSCHRFNLGCYLTKDYYTQTLTDRIIQSLYETRTDKTRMTSTTGLTGKTEKVV